ncbi:hypothetical protein BGZ58_000613 [Dissophora ornata]|nr:hypothetical protein BGZ58_000613 [Dissophora ornata]
MVSKGSKRRAKSQQSYEGSLQWIDDCKRTRSSSVEAAKNVKAQDHKDGGKPLARIAKKKSSEPLDSEKKPVVPKGLYSVTGDEYALKPRRRRKRRDAVPVQAEDPFAPNDGDIEIIEETLPLLSRAARVKASLISDPTGALFRIPERSIKLGFLEKCQRLQQPPIQDPPKPLSSRDDSHRFEILVAVVMACEGMTADTASNGSAQEKEGSSSGNSLYEGVQNAVLDQLADPEDRAAYSRFRALQRVVRENGLGTSGAMNGGA